MGADGFPTVPPPRPGAISLAMLNGRARWATINTTMEDLASFLALELNQPVIDSTGLKARFDFTLSWVFDNRESADASIGFSGLTLAQAVQEQLGLKLERKKGSVDVFVVDHVDKTPAGN
jgi:uncharacterized protein (TIGR03435 family)